MPKLGKEKQKIKKRILDIAAQLDNLKKGNMIMNVLGNVQGIEKLLETTSTKLHENDVEKDQEMKDAIIDTLQYIEAKVARMVKDLCGQAAGKVDVTDVKISGGTESTENDSEMFKNRLMRMEEIPDYVKIKIIFDKSKMRLLPKLEKYPKYGIKLETAKVAFLRRELFHLDEPLGLALIKTSALVEPLERGRMPVLTYQPEDGGPRRQVGGSFQVTARELGLKGSLTLL